jgi:3-polyprenyl-4-hydroxybenzoate decarboxylase and related decarboxylases
LEVSSLSNYYQKKKRTALLFNNPSGYNNVLLIGLFGTYSRLQNMMERNVSHILKNFASLFWMLYSKLGILEGLKLFSKLENFSVNEVGNGPVRNLNGNITLDDIQILEHWLKNGDF